MSLQDDLIYVQLFLCVHLRLHKIQTGPYLQYHRISSFLIGQQLKRNETISNLQNPMALRIWFQTERVVLIEQFLKLLVKKSWVVRAASADKIWKFFSAAVN